MRRRDKPKRTRQKPDRSPANFPTLPYRPSTGVIGMVSIKTIKTRNGRIVIKQGERINETTLQEEEALNEVLANAMPGRAGGK